MSNKSKTILYIFIHTILLQLIVIVSLGTCLGLVYFGFTKYNIGILFLLSVVAFIVLIFLYMSVTVFSKSYGVSLFSKKRHIFDTNDYTAYDSSRPIKEYEFSLGRKNMITGNRSLIVREKEVNPGGTWILFFVSALIIGLTGVIKFLIESVRVIRSEERQLVWDEAREFLLEKISEEGKDSFFKVPRICAIILSLIMIVSFPIAVISIYKYSPDRIEMVFSEKEYYTNYNPQVCFIGSVENTGSAKVRAINGVLYFSDKNGNLLYETNMGIDVPFSIPSPDDDYLTKGEKWGIKTTITVNQNDSGTVELWNADLKDVEIKFKVNRIAYDGNYIEFEDKWIAVKTVKN